MPMSPAALSTDGFRLALLAAIAGSLGCGSGSGGTRTDAGDAELSRGFSACSPTGDLGYSGSGVVQCSERFLHRARALECRPDLLRPGAAGYPASRSEASANSSCFTDQDCPQGYDGMCVLRDQQLLCAYGCRQDEDCGAGQLCLCNEGLAGECVPAECRTDADCAAGSLCTGPANLGGYVTLHFSCQQASDECAGDADCGSQTYCQFDSQLGHKVCRGIGAVPGRPFLVQGAARLAAVTASSGWLGSSAAAADADGPSPSADERAQVVEHWLRVAQMEHASVAAFARFALQLLSLGAPARLLQAASAAQADEIRHAEAAFRVASHFHGAAFGPGPLALGDLALGETLEQIVVGTVLEGCVGETLAALEAAEALAHAEHPLARAALERVAEDEARHAELAWSFLAWALERHGDQLLGSVTAAFDRARNERRAPSTRSGLEPFGVLGAAAAERVRHEAWQAVILPCLERLRARLQNRGTGQARCAGGCEANC
jgi:hypothetical protein